MVRCLWCVVIMCVRCCLMFASAILMFVVFCCALLCFGCWCVLLGVR